MRTRVPALLAASAALAATACTAVLGLDPSVKDPCILGGCVDGSTATASAGNGATGVSSDDAGGAGIVDATSPPSNPPSNPNPPGNPPADASAPDTAPNPALTLRFGTSTYCDPQREYCCATTISDGGYTFACVPNNTSCPGVPITCARESDCDIESVCCVTNGEQTCLAPSACNGGYVCDPDGGPYECPQGDTCDPFSNANVPYFECHY